MSLFVVISLCVTDSSLSQVNTPPLSPEEAETIKPLQKIVEAVDKQDMELYMSVYHKKAIIETTTGRQITKDELRKHLKFTGNVAINYYVEKIQLKGDKATINCTLKEGDRVIPMKFDLVKEGGTWLIMRRWLR